MTEQVTFHLPELIAAAVFILSGGGLGTFLAKSKGWITFGKPAERRNCPDAVRKVCSDHTAMVVDMSNMTLDVSDLKTDQKKNNDLLHDISSNVDRLVGYHLGQNGIDLGQRL